MLREPGTPLIARITSPEFYKIESKFRLTLVFHYYEILYPRQKFCLAIGSKMSEMFTYNMIDCITANSSGIISMFWKMRTGWFTFSDVSCDILSAI
jgi:hypothetical protein